MMSFVCEIHELRERQKIIEKYKNGEITEDEALKEINRRAKLWEEGERVIL